MPIDFSAIDFETANAHPASACAVGLVRVRAGHIVDRAHWLIKPPAGCDTFLPFHSKLHGITAEDVVQARGWVEQLPAMLDFIGGDVVVAHNAGFDMKLINAACAQTITPTPKLQYLCSLQVSRKTYTLSSHSLPLAAAAAGVTDFTHHEALADAEACAAIVIDASHKHGADSVKALAQTAGLRLRRLTAIPLKL